MIDINKLKNMSSVQTFKSGQIIIKDGDATGDDMYIILKGSVEVLKNYMEPHEVKIATLQAGSFFGEMSLFLNKARTATIVALGEVTILAINRLNAYSFFESQPEATFLLIKSLCTRLESLTVSYEKLSRQSNDAPKKEAEKPVVSQKTDDSKSIPAIFPKGHKKYNISFNSPDSSLIYEKTHECPLCDYKFKAIAIKESHLTLEFMDRDFRPNYKGIDTLYYDVITCPNCWYSSLANVFKSARSTNYNALIERTTRHKTQFTISFDSKREADNLFKMFYLALECAPLCFIRHEITTAKLWLRISWLYHDCEDEDMELFAVKQAQKAYITAYEKVDVNSAQMQQFQLLIAELSFKIKDFKAARHFLYLAKTCEYSKPTLLSQADNLMAELSKL